MLGKPKYTYGEYVKFVVRDTKKIEKTKAGKIWVVDAYGTFEDNTDVSYDIYVDTENTLYKHVKEDKIVDKCC